ncbi:hypothetical protein CQA66_08360 [Helicobacter aurati]|uniref:DUF2213 domain-containing protein n=1 Tax=Helicobacter aurati TaxID=137778 RepID=A0A3D8J0V7_9HELI|nr:DUF2213 domain-containing protein [Helicobacter aurati]RDU70411.1 hypothetical protein CQA66_08360 [Helicobacter aurati]
MNNIFSISENRYIDSNEFLYIKDNAIMKSGVFEYVGNEIGLNDDKIYKVYRPKDELEKVYKSFANKPITLEHEWISIKDNPDRVVGNIGSNITFDKDSGCIIADLLTITNKDAIQDIMNGIRDKLSAGFTQDLIKEDGTHEGIDYQYKQVVTEINHLALCKIPRDSSLIVHDSKNKYREAFKMGYKNLLNSFNSFMKIKGIHAKDSIPDEVIEKVKEALEIVKKSDSDFEGGHDEKILKVLEISENIPFDFQDIETNIDKQVEFKKLKELKDDDIESAYEILRNIAYNPTQDSETENTEDKTQDDNVNQDLESIIRSVISEELKKVLGAKDSEEQDKETKDSECKDNETETSEETKDNIDIEAIKEEITEEIKEQLEKDESEFIEAYDSVSNIVGKFSPYNSKGKRKSVNEIYDYGLKMLSLQNGINVGKVKDSKSAFIACYKTLEKTQDKIMDSKKVNNEIKTDYVIPGEIIKARS